MSNLIKAIRKSVIGENTCIETPFGQKPLIYADYTASGRSLSFIEDFIRLRVLPFYANTHTETSFTGAQTTSMREQARSAIRSAVNGSSEDQIIFCGSGATAAIFKLIDILNLKLPTDLNDRYQLEKMIPTQERPVVFIGPYEHHSNELPWRESIVELVTIPLNENGQLDVTYLKEQLIRYRDRRLKIGSFSAASNVTGIKTDTDSVARLLHQYGALSFWDYAAAAPYVGIDMNGEQNQLGDSSKDAVFISTHKFIGGPGTPGILIVKKTLLNNRVPAIPGGGTVIYVTPEDHRYIDNSERREEGGTPAIIESIRAGLVFKLQQDVGTKTIERLEENFTNRAISRWRKNKNIEILGNPDIPRLSITSLRIKHNGDDLHYGFVVALLNDLFGIQARGGCSCAGPYGHSLLRMDMAYSKALESQLLQGHMILRPGWVRLNFNYFIDEATFNYLITAVELIADNGWRLLPFYNFDTAEGVWRFQNEKIELPNQLNQIDPFKPVAPLPSVEFSLKDLIDKGQQELCMEDRNGHTYEVNLPENAENLRWFARPQDIRAS